MIWQGSVFGRSVVTAGAVSEFNLISNSTLAAIDPVGTIGPIYGAMRVCLLNETADADGDFAWGIRVLESDVAASTSVYSPYADSDTTDWITWRAGNVFVPPPFTAAGTLGQGQVWDESFTIRNPRKYGPDKDLVMVFENGGATNLGVFFWARVGVLLS